MTQRCSSVRKQGVNKVISSGKEILARHRVRWRRTKCSILVHPGRSERVYEVDENGGRTSPPEFKVVDSGIEVLGTPVGTQGFRREMLETAFTAMAMPLPALTRITSQSAYILLQQCFNARPCFLTRVSEPDLYMSFAHIFDNAIDEALAAIALTELTPEISTLRSLPQSMGGLSLTRHCGPQSEKGCLASRVLTKDFVEKHRPELARGMERWRPMVIGGDDTGRRQQAERLIEAAEESFAELDLSLPRDLQLLLADHKYTWMTLYKKLLDSGRRHHAAWLVSSSSIGTGKWLNWRGGFEGRLRFSKDEFVEALRLRLLVDPFPNPGDKVCPLCGLVRFAESPLHVLDCAVLRPSQKSRHDIVGIHLANALKKCFPEAQVRREHTVSCNEAETTLQADIHMERGPRVFIFDVAVVDPAAPSYLSHDSYKEENVAAKQREAAKRAEWTARGGVNNAEFIPFVVEASGRMGPSALSYFMNKLVSAEGPYIAKSFLMNMNFSIARANARMILECRRGHRLARPAPPAPQAAARSGGLRSGGGSSE